MAADVRSSVVGRKLSRCLVTLSFCHRRWSLLRFNVRGNEIECSRLDRLLFGLRHRGTYLNRAP
jgi:hypothetical protein